MISFTSLLIQGFCFHLRAPKFNYHYHQHHHHHILQEYCEADTITISILQMRNLSLRMGDCVMTYSDHI